MSRPFVTLQPVIARSFVGLALVALAACLIPSAGAEPLRAVTEDGRQVLLEDDGRWRFVEDDGAGVVHRLALSASSTQDLPNGCRVTMHLVNLSTDEVIDNFTPRVAFWRSGRLTPMREIVRFRTIEARGTQDVPLVLRYVACKDLQRIEIPTLQDACRIGGVDFEDFECLDWTRPDPGVIPITIG